jgi:arylesterase / paraoxonase
MWRPVLVGLGVTVLLLGGFVVGLFDAAGQFKRLNPHFDGMCRTVAGVIGAEDITIHPRTGVAYLSACDRLSALSGRQPRGAIYAYDLTAALPQPVNVTPDADPAFAPHGLSLHVAPDGTSTLFVINHAGGRHTIEIYDVVADRLAHRATLSDSLLVSPNDLVAVTPTQVYVTNDHRYRAGWMRTIEEYFRRPWANVVMWDGTRFREAAGGIRLANGINASPDGRTVYVMGTIGGAVRLYDRDPASGALSFRREIPLGTGGDNIEVDADGTLWIGAHPKLLTVVRYMKGAIPQAPSQVLHIRPRDGEDRIDEVFLDLGGQLSASSVAAVRGKRLLIGPVADSKFLDCEMR